jgi:hypothetical protein
MCTLAPANPGHAPAFGTSSGSTRAVFSRLSGFEFRVLRQSGGELTNWATQEGSESDTVPWSIVRPDPVIILCGSYEVHHNPQYPLGCY